MRLIRETTALMLFGAASYLEDASTALVWAGRATWPSHRLPRTRTPDHGLGCN